MPLTMKLMNPRKVHLPMIYNKFRLAWSQLMKGKVQREEDNRIFDEFLKGDMTCDNLTWSEGDTWYGWTYNPVKKRYYFDDIGNTSLMGLWDDQWLREADENI
jgi:hypothetical protein